MIGKAGIGTPHMDGNTRLCTATAAAALKASFGTDGQPGSYTDVDHCDAIALWGHNVAETQTVLWMRMLDRRSGPNPPAMLAVDPRATPVARAADLHLAVRNGTNMALMNGLLRELIRNGWYDEQYVAAAACQVNNIHLLRCMLGRPGAGVYQMNGQPTAQNTRETGADGDLPGMRNWENPEHIRQLAELWNVDPAIIPHWSPPTHAMQVFRYAEQGSIKLLWISATNPAVSLPDLARIRRILAKEDLFVVVQDLFRTETAELADVVLPAATWGEKTGNPDDAGGLGIGEGDLVRVQSPRGALRAWARVCGVRRGVVFVPFHYGYWDADGEQTRAANELTITAWDPVSKQPIYKVAAVRVVKEADAAGVVSPAPTVGGSVPVDPRVPATACGPAAETSVRTAED